MKLIFFILTIFLVTAAAAQEKETPNPLKKTPTPFLYKDMRYDTTLGRRSVTPNDLSLLLQEGAIVVSPNGTILSPNGSTVLSNGNKVYTLPQDHMPCVVPDMKQFNMPNAGKNVQIYQSPDPNAIPNPLQGKSISFWK